MKRNIKFWTRYTWESVGADMVIVGVMALLTIFGASELEWSLFASAAPYYLCFAAMFGMLMINMGSQTLYVPLLISMGETRRNVLLGFHYYRALIIVVTMALCGLIWLLVPGEISATGLRSLPTMLFALITVSAFGSIMGTVFTRWKWLGTIIIIILCGGFGGIVGMLGVSALEGFALRDILHITAALEHLPWWLVLAALAVLAADVAFQWLLLRRQEVKL